MKRCERPTLERVRVRKPIRRESARRKSTTIEAKKPTETESSTRMEIATLKILYGAETMASGNATNKSELKTLKKTAVNA